MPEYLAPGVYVEELDLGVRPIEGVSTSTAGMVGVSERGPVNVPLLVTSFGEYERLFGGHLDTAIYHDAGFLPHAVEGFFQNGGRRLYVTRVAADQSANPATAADVMLSDRGDPAVFADTRLLKHARAGDAFVVSETVAGLDDDDSIRIGDGASVEYPTLAALEIDSAKRMLALRIPLYAGYAADDNVFEVQLAPPANPYAGNLEGDHAAGTRLLILDKANPPSASLTGILEIGTGADREYGIVESVSVEPAGPRVLLTRPLGRAHADNEAVVLVDATTTPASKLSNRAEPGDGLLLVANTTGYLAGDVVFLQNAAGTNKEYHVLTAFHPMSLKRPAYADHPAREPVRAVKLDDAQGQDAHSTELGADARVGDRTLLLVDTGLQIHDRVRIGPAGPTAEFHVVASVEGFTITLRQGLHLARLVGEQVVRVTRTELAVTRLTQDVGHGETTVFLADHGAELSATKLVEIGDPGSLAVEYQVLDTPSLGVLALAEPLAADHARGSLLGRRNPLLRVQALDVGAWGNGLSVVAEDDSLLATTVAQDTQSGQPIPLASAAGVEVGTVLDFDGTLAKVTSVAGNRVEVSPPLAVSLGKPVRSREFRLRVEWRKNGRVYRDEALRNLSFDPRHSRYVETIAGRIDGPKRPADRRPEGQSDFIRVEDQAPAQGEALLRVGPDLVVEAGFGGRLRAVGRRLAGGGDPLAGIVASTYIGVDNIDPDERTGLQTLRNIRRISIVAIPGRVEPEIQEALVGHCELERFRFAVLDSVPGTNRVLGALLPEVQTQRNQLDTRYAALYYPWLVVRDPFPVDPANPVDLAIPPSGHMIGIYARTDQERGVHKAPANVVIRGIRALQRRLNQSEQDILNPSPTNINVLRDFRDSGRGLRVWGARCITSDTDWKYVNVRRLFLFLEQSLYEGTQWVVFEPNDLPLWARVRQSIGNFLTRVWRDGALQGGTPEEAFFVKCDRTTMTQDDIDNGRLIVMIGVAPVKPAEFVIIRIFQSTLEAAAV